jgi:hypothetical protein
MHQRGSVELRQLRDDRIPEEMVPTGREPAMRMTARSVRRAVPTVISSSSPVATWWLGLNGHPIGVPASASCGFGFRRARLE